MRDKDACSMSDEHFLSRWSRRKREAEEADAQAAPAASPPAARNDTPASSADTAREAEPAAAPPAAAADSADLPIFDPARLPPIESITAETDIRPFLAPGVPPETTRVALRRAWSADPAIRDFVGLAEYAWDFTKPDAMRGFGPLQMTDALRRYAAQIFGAPEDDAAPTAQASDPSGRSAAEEKPQLALHEPTRRNADAPVTASVSGGRENVITESKDIAPQHEDNAASLPRRSHGGALPE
jgi:hypothetical protein